MGIQFDGFAINIYLDEDKDWYAHFVEIPNISAFSDTLDGAIDELEIAWQLYKETCKKIGKAIPVPADFKEYSGQFNVRIDKRVHKALAIEALQAGITLNALVAQKLYASTEPNPQKNMDSFMYAKHKKNPIKNKPKNIEK